MKNNYYSMLLIVIWSIQMVRMMEASTVTEESHYQKTSPSLLEQVTNLSVDDAVHALVHGPGFVLFPGFYNSSKIDAINIAMSTLLQKTSKKGAWSSDTGHGNIYTTGRRSLDEEGEEEHKDGQRVWNLVNKGVVFEELVQDPRIMAINDRLIGSDHILGSFAANVLTPGSARQLPHLDYPYWDYNAHSSWPQNPRPLQSSFLMNIQTALMLDDFTVENGATAVLPYSQKECRWPDLQEFEDNAVRVTGKKGTLFMFTGLLHHASMDNESNNIRAGILGQYLPKFVRPMEDPAAVGKDVRERASDRLLTLLGSQQPYPKNFDLISE